jgi:GntR family transcriptional regulator
MQLSTAHSPKYVQLAELFRQRIAKGVWRHGERLPTLEQLCKEYGIARVTARQAMDQLVREGLVVAQRGRGTFVTGELRHDHWLRVETTLAKLGEVYRDTQPTILTIDESDSARAPLLQPDDGVPAERYIYMRRVHAREGRPYCVIGIHLDADVFARNPLAFRTGTVIPLLTGMRGLKIASARQVLTIGTADLEVARHLGVPVNAPVAEVRRVVTAAKRRVIYVAEVTYRGDFVRVDFDLKAG